MEDLEEKKEHKELRQRFNRETKLFALFNKIEYIYWLEKQVVDNVNTVKPVKVCSNCNGKGYFESQSGFAVPCECKLKQTE